MSIQRMNMMNFSYIQDEQSIAATTALKRELNKMFKCACHRRQVQYNTRIAEASRKKNSNARMNLLNILWYLFFFFFVVVSCVRSSHMWREARATVNRVHLNSVIV